MGADSSSALIGSRPRGTCPTSYFETSLRLDCEPPACYGSTLTNRSHAVSGDHRKPSPESHVLAAQTWVISAGKAGGCSAARATDASPLRRIDRAAAQSVRGARDLGRSGAGFRPRCGRPSRSGLCVQVLPRLGGRTTRSCPPKHSYRGPRNSRAALRSHRPRPDRSARPCLARRAPRGGPADGWHVHGCRLTAWAWPRSRAVPWRSTLSAAEE